jgi:hypothetical protein
MRPQAGEVDETVDRTQEVVGRDVTIDAELVEQRFLHHGPLAHHHFVLPTPGTTESELHTDSNADFFNGIRPKQTSPSLYRCGFQDLVCEPCPDGLNFGMVLIADPLDEGVAKLDIQLCMRERRDEPALSEVFSHQDTPAESHTFTPDGRFDRHAAVTAAIVAASS